MFGIIIIVTAVTLFLTLKFLRRGRNRRITVPPAGWKKDTVYLFMFPRKITKQVVNLSPFAIKVETWLRLHNIKYEVTETSQFSPKRGQIPYVWFNGEWIEDSDYIIECLSKHYSIEEPLSKEELAQSRAFRLMVEQNTAGIVFWYRYVKYTKEFSRVFRINGSWLWKKFASKANKLGNTIRAHSMGIGRDSLSRNAAIANDDLQALCDFLGDKQYLMGDTMTKVDCSVFGVLCQVAYVDMPYPQKQLLDGTCKSVQEYLLRIKEKLWPDWSQLCDMENKFN